MAVIPESARAIIESGKLAHVVTTNKDGSPQVSCVWVGLDGDEIVMAHLGEALKVKNMRRNQRVALSIEGDKFHDATQEYLVVYGTARITEGGAADLLRRLGLQYTGKEFEMDFPGGGLITHITPERFSGTGPWAGNVPA